MSLRKKLIRLAFEQPQLRDELLPLITKSAGGKSLTIKDSRNNVTILLKKEWYSKPSNRNGFRDDLIQAKFFVYGGSVQSSGRGTPGMIKGLPVFAEVYASEQPSGEMSYELGREYARHPDYKGNKYLDDFLQDHQDDLDRKFF